MVNKPQIDLDFQQEPAIDLDYKEQKQVVPTTTTRPSNPIKQGIAGLSDIVTSIPTLAGLAGAGLETIGRQITGPKDETIADSFRLSMSNGVDAGLIDLGTSGMEAVNNTLGIDHPVSTEDQAARIIGSSLIPIPATALGSKVGQAAAWLTPVLRVGGPKTLGLNTAGRGAAQVGLNAGIDQGIRASLDQPTMLSDEALFGTPTPEGIDLDFQEANATNTIDLDYKGDAISIDLDFVENAAASQVPDQDDILVQMNNKLEEELDRKDTLLYLAIAGTVVGGLAARKALAARSKDALAKNAPSITAPLGTMPKETTSLGEATKTLYGKTVDMRAIEADALAKAGYSDDAIKQHTQQIDTQFKSLGIAQQFIREGVARVTGKQVTPLSTLKAEFSSLTPDQQATFNNGMIAKSELANRQRAGTKLGLYSQQADRLFTDSELKVAADALDRDPMLSTMANKYRENLDAVLDDAVAVGVIDPTDVATWRKDFSINGKSAYMPFYEAQGKGNFLDSLKAKWWPKQMREHQNEIGRWESRTFEAGEGTKQPLAPFEAAERYILETIDYTNRNAAGFNFVRRLAHMDTNLNPLVGHVGHRQAIYVGARKTSSDSIEFAETFLRDKSKLAKDARDHSFKRNPQNVLGDENVITYRHSGQEHVFFVPNKGVRDTLLYRPELYGALKFMNRWKDIMTQGTTGNVSLFAPISNIYSVGQIGLNAAISNKSLTEIPKAALDSATGTWHLFANRMSKQLADVLTVRINSDTGLSSLAPDVATKLRDRMQRRFEKSIINPVLRESGAFQTSLGSKDQFVDVTNLVENALPDINKSWGKDFARQTWYMWKHLNEALREGPVLGRALREIGDIDGLSPTEARKAIREGTMKARDFGGDFSRVGSSKTAKVINATVPFSGAMIQSWNSIGRAIAKNPEYAIPAITTAVSLPTGVELTWNEGLNRAYPEMGYQDHYWNVLTTQQRISNFVFYLPGLPPERAILVPVAPEFSVVRALTIEGMDSVFGFSSVGQAGMLGQNGDNMLEALSRVFDTPLPPLLSAAASGLGVDLRIGPQETINQEGGTSLNVASGRSITAGQRLTGTGTSDKYVNDFVDQKVSNIIGDIFGSSGAMLLGVANAFNANLDRGPLEATFDAFDELTHGLQKQARYTQPLFGKAISPNPNNETSRQVLSKVNALKRMTKDAKVLEGLGRGTPTQPNVGNTVEQTRDPIYAYVAVDAQEILNDVAVHDEQIAFHRNAIATLGNADKNLLSGKELSIKEKNEEIDTHKLMIQQLKFQQLRILQFHEEKIGKAIGQKFYNDPTRSFKFDELQSRANGSSEFGQSPRSQTPVK